MRIISGRFRSRRLHAPRDASTTRPIPDRVKESLYNLLRGHIEDAVLLDCFAGTGSFGLEALSRGASRCYFVERDRAIANLLERNIAELRVEDECEVIVGDALGPATLLRCPDQIDLIFMDPPYPLARDEEGWGRIRTQASRLVERLSDDGYLMIRTPYPLLHIVEPHPQPDDPDEPENLHIEISIDSPDDLDEAMDEPFAKLFGAAVGKPEFIDVDMDIAGADGPETREYGTMAVHLYVRSR